MKIHYLALTLPFFLMANASETPTKVLQNNLAKIFEHYTEETLTKQIYEELQLTDILEEVPWAFSRIKANQDKILINAEKATVKDNESSLNNHAAAITMLKRTHYLAGKKGHELRGAFDTKRINKALKHITAIKEVKQPTQYTSSPRKILLFIAGLALSGYGIRRFFFRKKISPDPRQQLKPITS